MGSEDALAEVYIYFFLLLWVVDRQRKGLHVYSNLSFILLLCLSRCLLRLYYNIHL